MPIHIKPLVRYVAEYKCGRLAIDVRSSYVPRKNDDVIFGYDPHDSQGSKCTVKDVKHIVNRSRKFFIRTTQDIHVVELDPDDPEYYERYYHLGTDM